MNRRVSPNKEPPLLSVKLCQIQNFLTEMSFLVPKWSETIIISLLELFLSFIIIQYILDMLGDLSKLAYI